MVSIMVTKTSSGVVGATGVEAIYNESTFDLTLSLLMLVAVI